MEKGLLLHSILIKYFKGGTIEMGNFVPENEVTDSLQRIDKVKQFVLLQNVCEGMLKENPEIAQEIQKLAIEKREKTESLLQYHRSVEHEKFIKDQKIISSPEHTSKNVNKGEVADVKGKGLWLPSGSVVKHKNVQDN